MASQVTPQAPAAPPAQICGEFHGQAQLDAARSRLEGSDFQRADLIVRTPGGQPGGDDPVRADDAQNLRELGVGTAAAIAGLAAAGVVVATGGAALPAVAAALVAGGGTAAVGEVIGSALAPAAMAASGLVLLVHAASPALREKAEAVMRDCGATRVWAA